MNSSSAIIATGVEILPAEWDAGRERGGEKIRKSNDQLVIVALGILDVEKSFAASSAGFIDHHNRLFGQIVLGDDALHHTGHLVRAPAGTGGNNDFDGLGGLPCLGGHGRKHAANTNGGQT